MVILNKKEKKKKKKISTKTLSHEWGRTCTCICILDINKDWNVVKYWRYFTHFFVSTSLIIIHGIVWSNGPKFDLPHQPIHDDFSVLYNGPRVDQAQPYHICQLTKVIYLFIYYYYYYYFNFSLINWWNNNFKPIFQFCQWNFSDM